MGSEISSSKNEGSEISSSNNEGSEIFSRNEGSEIKAQKNEGTENHTREIEGSENLSRFSRKHSGRLFPIKNDRPLRSAHHTILVKLDVESVKEDVSTVERTRNHIFFGTARKRSTKKLI